MQDVYREEYRPTKVRGHEAIGGDHETVRRFHVGFREGFRVWGVGSGFGLEGLGFRSLGFRTFRSLGFRSLWFRS